MNKAPGTSTPTKPTAIFDRSPNFSARSSPIRRVILHYTTSRNINGVISWFRNPQSRVSAHYVIGTDGYIAQMVRDADKAWHAFGENDDSIGIEICAEKGDRLTPEQTASLVALLRWLLAEYHLKPEAITAHRFTPSNRGQTDCPGDLWPTERVLREWVKANVVPPAKEEPKEPKGTGLAYAPCPVPLPPWRANLGSYVATGEDVYQLQCALIGLGYLAKPKDGDLVGDVFNEHVEWAVKRFQEYADLDVDGIVGPNTRRELEKALTAARAPKPAEPKPEEGVAYLVPMGDRYTSGRWTGLLRLKLIIGDDYLLVCSGQARAQVLRKPTDPRSVPGCAEPIPQGRYRIEPIDFAGAIGDYSASWGEGLGPVWVGLTATFSDDRSAFGIHGDYGAVGTMGCIGVNPDELWTLVGLLSRHRPSILSVEYGL